MKNYDIIKKKIPGKEELSAMLYLWRFQQKKIVFTNGCFDLLHLGHVNYLSQAKDCGDVLLVGINTDRSVKMLGKGSNRPITDENARATIVAALNFVDAVVLFDEKTPYELIQKVQPDVLVKGSDYRPEDIVGYDIVKKKGGEVVTIDFLPGYSTSSIVEKIKEGD